MGNICVPTVSAKGIPNSTAYMVFSLNLVVFRHSDRGRFFPLLLAVGVETEDVYKEWFTCSCIRPLVMLTI